ncbi:MAG: aldo/keto reductase [Mucilaginibacter sp.]
MDTKNEQTKPYQKVVLGTAGLGGIWRKVNGEESIKTMLDAFQHGILSVDTAPAYGDAESYLGAALELWDGPKPMVSTKVGRSKSYASDECYFNYSNESMIASVENSLRVIGVPVIDLLFLHEPSAVPKRDIDRVVKQMLWFKENGYATKIGLGGNLPVEFAPYLSLRYFDVLMEYNRLNACVVDALNTSLITCEKEGIDYFVASPLNMGLLGINFQRFIDAPPQWLDAKSVIQAQKINALAHGQNCTISTLAHRFLLTFQQQFKIVFGPSDLSEWEESLQAINLGALPQPIFEDILKTFN